MRCSVPIIAVVYGSYHTGAGEAVDERAARFGKGRAARKRCRSWKAVKRTPAGSNLANGRSGNSRDGPCRTNAAIRKCAGRIPRARPNGGHCRTIIARRAGSGSGWSIFDRAGIRAARTGRRNHSRVAHSNHRYRRRAGLRWTGARLSRSCWDWTVGADSAIRAALR